MKNYNRWNIILAWFCFAIAAFTYLSTIEPSVSFWDCGEFMAAANKLMICHPPGAPLFLMMARVFAFMAPSPDKVALMINAMSALCSAFTILFLYWTITHLAKRLLTNGEVPSKGATIAILGSGLIGALSYTFTDSFWFSAVEGEVYAMSSLFTAVVFWAILKWEEEATQPHALRWLVLIGYLLGLSIGVHLLNLLAIPAIALVFYYKHSSKPTIKGIVLTLLISTVILGFVMYGVIPGTVQLSALVDLFFVNGLGLPFNSGTVFFFLLILATLAYVIFWSQRKKYYILNTACSFFLVLFIGYSSFAMVVIRSNAKPTMNQNAPDDAYSLLSYLNREQYGERPLLYGQYYNSPVIKHNESGVKRDQIDGKYETVGAKYDREYDSKMSTVFPRMWSDQKRHITEYKRWANIKGTDVKSSNGKILKKPTFTENLRYLFRYQLGHMYGRYFMWNFVGRQNDVSGHGNSFDGNWISGIGAVDRVLVGGNQDLLPDLMKAEKSRNTYYFLPLLLGVLGIAFQWKKRKTKGAESFLIVGILFVLTGVAIVIYLNQYPLQPRERDYAYAASFYAFAIWIGLGVLYLWHIFSKLSRGSISAVVAIFMGAAVPCILAQQNWNDHNRSDRYVARDTAYNYLMSCEPNAILFTFADNDTFPIWYLQEVEGIRTDVRVCNITYMNTEWYLEHLRSANKDGLPIDFNLTNEDTRMSKNVAVYLIDQTSEPIAFNSALAWLKSDNPKTKMIQGQELANLPSKQFFINVDKSALMKDNVISAKDSKRIVDKMTIDYSAKRVIYKNNLMTLDLLESNDWKRPVYYATSVSPDLHFGLDKYFQRCGTAYQVLPMISDGAINTEKMYDNMMNKFHYGNIKGEDIYLDNDSRKQALQVRRSFVSLANALYTEGQTSKAKEVMKRCLVEIPSNAIPYHCLPPYQNDFLIVDTLIKLKMKDEAITIIDEMHYHIKQDMDFYLSFKNPDNGDIKQKLHQNISSYYQLNKIVGSSFPKNSKVIRNEFETYYKQLNSILNLSKS